jgi:hypothetical protein
LAAVPYDPVSTSVLASAFKRSLHAEPEGDDILLSGECPRCKHDVYKLVAREAKHIVPGVAAEAVAEGLKPRAPRGCGRGYHEKHVLTLVACNCDSKHDGRPDGELGCGVYAQLTVSFCERDDQAS